MFWHYDEVNFIETFDVNYIKPIPDQGSEKTLNNLMLDNEDDRDVLRMIIDRDLKIGLQRDFVEGKGDGQVFLLYGK